MVSYDRGPPEAERVIRQSGLVAEMIIWGGEIYPITVDFGTGGRYNPSTDTWTRTSTIGAPAPRALHAAVWTGSEMIVWGGLDQNGCRLEHRRKIRSGYG